MTRSYQARHRAKSALQDLEGQTLVANPSDRSTAAPPRLDRPVDTDRLQLPDVAQQPDYSSSR